MTALAIMWIAALATLWALWTTGLLVIAAGSSLIAWIVWRLFIRKGEDNWDDPAGVYSAKESNDGR